ncbi:NAD(P)/FAD-dependent oxidoreductase [Sphingobium sp. H33]|uniref:NAD(P)/FAD-dependent oxidoreductase n=2 Tax=Sphingobium nicotianae TaxID=2782607 RepID=A0A9X1IQQ2_9SPHN|nr:NAD(P)/FAD-dependent oxidoreductase [Sphingobium nicotianae]
MVETGAQKEARTDLLAASDATIDDAVTYGDPMVLRGLVYLLTGDPELKTMATKTVAYGQMDAIVPASDEEVAMIRRKAADFLKAYRDGGAGPIGFGAPKHVRDSMELVLAGRIPEEDLAMATEELALDPWARSLQWQSTPDSKRLGAFSVTVIGTGMGGLNAALQLKRAGINYMIFEKNNGVGGTWYENRYPGARVDGSSRTYSHLFGVDFPCPYNYAPQERNQAYFDWVADEFGLRDEIIFNTEVTALTWDEQASMWEIEAIGPNGKETHRSNAVITSVGFLNRPNIPQIEGMETFGGPSWHTVHWPEGADLADKRVAVVGTGCTGYQMVPELAKEAAHISVFQRTPQWLMPMPGYLAEVPDGLKWLDRNMPYHTNFMRLRHAYRIGDFFSKVTEIDPDFDDPYSVSAANKALRDRSVEFLEKKLGDRMLGDKSLVEIMTPKHPVWSARIVLVDSDDCILDALQLDNVELVTSGAERINTAGIVDGAGKQHDVDVIVYATGFKANDYLYPMKITGRNGLTIDQLWAVDGARAYLGCMMPGFPNLWSIYGPNTNGGLQVAAYHELTTLYALQCIEKLILERKETIEVKEEAYWRYSRFVDERNSRRVWSDKRAHSYYWDGGRSPGMNPLTATENYQFMRYPDFNDMNMK